ncbi:TonB-dependent siderophore receptor, partial [Steroidobacter sp.]|uniref:TonB-dependent siderophore receptor n=1 Tax=Steroidobacter sp. TaxID=1978227 RepID=UPI001A5B16E2
LTIGGRYTNYEQEEQSYRLLADGTRGPTTSFFAPIYSEHALIPSAALTYEISPRWNAYASYAQTFKPQTGLLKAPEPGVPLDPITGDGYEVGVKGEVFDGLNTSIAVYSVKRIGEGLEDPAYGINYGAGGSSCCYIDNGDITMQGVDFELSGVVTRDWQLFAGYTYARQKLGSTSGDTDAAMSFNFSPKHLFKMWTTWRLPGALSDWTFNAGVVTQSEILVLGSATVFNSSGVATGFVPFRYTQGGYSLWNASVQYRLSERWSAALYADNIFDKTYYAALNSSTGGNIYGEPRNLTLRLQAKF